MFYVLKKRLKLSYSAILVVTSSLGAERGADAATPQNVVRLKFK